MLEGAQQEERLVFFDPPKKRRRKKWIDFLFSRVGLVVLICMRWMIFFVFTVNFRDLVGGRCFCCVFFLFPWSGDLRCWWWFQLVLDRGSSLLCFPFALCNRFWTVGPAAWNLSGPDTSWNWENCEKFVNVCGECKVKHHKTSKQKKHKASTPQFEFEVFLDRRRCSRLYKSIQSIFVQHLEPERHCGRS